MDIDLKRFYLYAHRIVDLQLDSLDIGDSPISKTYCLLQLEDGLCLSLRSLTMDCYLMCSLHAPNPWLLLLLPDILQMSPLHETWYEWPSRNKHQAPYCTGWWCQQSLTACLDIKHLSTRWLWISVKLGMPWIFQLLTHWQKEMQCSCTPWIIETPFDFCLVRLEW